MEFFKTQILAAMASKPAEFLEFGAKFHVNITQDLWGSWLIDTYASGPSCTEVPDDDISDDGANITITVAAVDFQQVMHDPRANFMPVFFAGRIVCLGDVRLAIKFSDLLVLAST